MLSVYYAVVRKFLRGAFVVPACGESDANAPKGARGADRVICNIIKAVKAQFPSSRAQPRELGDPPQSEKSVILHAFCYLLIFGLSVRSSK